MDSSYLFLRSLLVFKDPASALDCCLRQGCGWKKIYKTIYETIFFWRALNKKTFFVNKKLQIVYLWSNFCYIIMNTFLINGHTFASHFLLYFYNIGIHTFFGVFSSMLEFNATKFKWKFWEKNLKKTRVWFDHFLKWLYICCLKIVKKIKRRKTNEYIFWTKSVNQFCK